MAVNFKPSSDGLSCTFQINGVDAVTFDSSGFMVVTTVTDIAQDALPGNHYILTNVDATTVTLPESPASGDTVWVTWTNTLATNTIARNSQTIMGKAEDMTLDASTNGTVQLRFVSSSWRIL